MENNTIALQKNTYLSGRYGIIRVLGMGGFGITYEAKDYIKNIRCSIKEYVPRDISVRSQNHTTLVPTSSSKKELYDHGMKRFIEEAKTLEQLNYVESVVSVYDFFYENGTCYFVMEYVDGCTLSKLVKAQNGKLDYKYIQEIFYDVGTALMQVHSLNIFHRDISPDNIMINSKGQVKLIDFGNAKNIVRKNDNTLSVILKPGFAPPEQYSSKSIQGTFTDVYAMASTMYYTMTGKRVPDAIERYKNSDNLQLKLEGFPDYISVAMDKALKLNYKERTQTIEEFLQDLHWIQHTESLSADGLNKEYQKKLEKQALEKYRQSIQMMQSKKQEVQLKPYLQILTGDNAGQTIMLPLNSGVIVGRANNLAQIVFLQDKYVSKKHCEVYYDSLNKTFYIEDFSTNGTWINGFRLNKNQVYTVSNGSVVVLANKVCSFKVGVV